MEFESIKKSTYWHQKKSLVCESAVDREVAIDERQDSFAGIEVLSPQSRTSAFDDGPWPRGR